MKSTTLILFFLCVSIICYSQDTLTFEMLNQTNTKSSLDQFVKENPDVKNLEIIKAQYYLKMLGYYTSKIDGLYNLQTQKALKGFCTKSGVLFENKINERIIFHLESTRLSPNSCGCDVFVDMTGLELKDLATKGKSRPIRSYGGCGAKATDAQVIKYKNDINVQKQRLKKQFSE